MFALHGITGAFPTNSWLVGLAKLYDKYRVIRLNLSFQPALPVTTGGVIGMWFDANIVAITNPTFSDLSGNMNAKTSSVHEPMQLQVRPDQMNRVPYYLAHNSVGGTTSTDLAAVGQMYLIWSAITLSNAAAAGATTLGYLWVDYEVELLNPSSPST